MLKSLHSAFTCPIHKMLLRVKQMLSGSTKKNFLVIFAGMVFKLQKSWVNFSFNPCPFLLTVATDDREQFQSLNMAKK